MTNTHNKFLLIGKTIPYTCRRTNEVLGNPTGGLFFSPQRSFSRLLSGIGIYRHFSNTYSV